MKLPGGGPATNQIQSPPPIDNLATPAQGTLKLGDATPVQTIALGADGASPTVSAPGQPWDGLEIDVPAGAWTGSTLQMTAQTINGSTFGDLITPITPLYTISGEEGMAPAPVTLKIPAVIPDDSFAMAFFYDASSGRLEGMPLLAEDGKSVTVATEHFSDEFVSLIKLALLPKTIDSGFRPGKDDWQFPNVSSYISTIGNCAGMVLTEAWYYIERQMKGHASHLNGLYDNNGGEKTPARWQDDSHAYRLASVAHAQYTANTGPGTADQFFKNWRTMGFDTLQYNAFRYAIAVTGEPQLISISDAHDGSGHAMLIYRVTPGDLLVADPNYQGEWRRIAYDAAAGKLGPYVSGVSQTAIEAGHSTTYVNFGYKAKTALVDWSALAADWAAFDAGTIGDDAFPAYDLEVMTGKDDDGNEIWAPLSDGYQTTNDKLQILISDPANSSTVRMAIYHGTSSTPDSTVGPELTVDLAAGENQLGLLEEAVPPSKTGFYYVDFVRLTVIRGPAEPSAAPSAIPASGHWVLSSVTPKGGPQASSFERSDETYRINSSNGAISFFYDYVNTGSGASLHRHEEASVSWGPPPASAAPGDAWTSNLTAQGTCSFDIDEQGWGASIYVSAFWTEAGEKHSKDWSAGVTCQDGSDSAALSWAFPAHDGSADTLEIDAVGSEEHGGDSWTYIYNWQP